MCTHRQIKLHVIKIAHAQTGIQQPIRIHLDNGNRELTDRFLLSFGISAISNPQRSNTTWLLLFLLK